VHSRIRWWQRRASDTARRAAEVLEASFCEVRFDSSPARLSLCVLRLAAVLGHMKGCTQ